MKKLIAIIGFLALAVGGLAQPILQEATASAVTTGTAGNVYISPRRLATALAGVTLPSQTGNTGKFLTTDGSVASWATLAGGGDMVLASAQTVTGAKTFGSAGAVGKLKVAGTTSGSTIINAAAVAGATTTTLPNADSTLPIFTQQVTFAGPTAARTYTLPDAAVTLANISQAQTFTGASTTTSWIETTPVITGGLTASGSGANTFGASTGPFITSTGANTLSGAVTVTDATTPSITLASGKTNTGFFLVNGKTSGGLKIIAADAAAQTVTLSLAAQTSGASTISMPDTAGVNDTFGYVTLAQTLSNKTLASPVVTTQLTTTSSTFALLNTTATTVNAFGAATTLNLGASATMILNFGGSTTASEFRFLEPSGSGTNYTAFKAVAQSANITYSLPPAVVAGGALTDVAGNGVLTWVIPSGSGTISSGVTNAIPKYTASTTLDDSLLSDDGTTLTYTGSGGIVSSGSATGIITVTGVTSGHLKITGADAMAQDVTVSLAAQTSGAATATIPDLAGVSQTFSFIGKAETLSGAKTFSGGILASGSNANDFSSGTGTFKTSTGANTLSGAVTVNDATTPSVTLASGKTNTGFFLVNGKTSGSLKIIAADAAAQAVTITLAAQTTGSSALTLPDMAGAAGTFAFINKAQTWTGVQSLTSPDETTSVTTTSTSFTAWAGATTLLTIGGTGGSASMFAPSTLDATSSTTGAIRTSGGISAAKSLNIGTTITGGGAFSIGTSNSATVGTIELGAASDTTISRSAAGVLAVEGNILSNVNPRITTVTSNATPTFSTDTADCLTITAQAAAITSMTTNMTGTGANFQQFEVRIKDDGTARAITWGANFVSGNATLPTTTIVSKALHVWFEYDSVQAKWVCVGTGSDA